MNASSTSSSLLSFPRLSLIPLVEYRESSPMALRTFEAAGMPRLWQAEPAEKQILIPRPAYFWFPTSLTKEGPSRPFTEKFRVKGDLSGAVEFRRKSTPASVSFASNLFQAFRIDL